MNVKQNLEEYIKHKFCVPCYQRGYKWGVEKKDGTTDASILVSDIIDAFHNSKEEYFIQGVTAYFKDKELYLIDGQQRTTTIFLLLAIINEHIEDSFLESILCDSPLNYDIRDASNEFLNHILKVEELPPEKNQDTFYFLLFRKSSV